MGRRMGQTARPSASLGAGRRTEFARSGTPAAVTTGESLENFRAAQLFRTNKLQSRQVSGILTIPPGVCATSVFFIPMAHG